MKISTIFFKDITSVLGNEFQKAGKVQSLRLVRSSPKGRMSEKLVGNLRPCFHKEVQFSTNSDAPDSSPGTLALKSWFGFWFFISVFSGDLVTVFGRSVTLT